MIHSQMRAGTTKNGQGQAEPSSKAGCETRGILIPSSFLLPDLFWMAFNLQSSFHFFTSEGAGEGRVCTALQRLENESPKKIISVQIQIDFDFI